MKCRSCSQAAVLVMVLMVKAGGQVPSAPTPPALVQPQAVVMPAATPSPSPQPAAPPAISAISQSGLLPLFAVDVQIDPAWVDGSGFPSASPQFPHNGVSDALQQAWDLLRTAGFNVIRFPTNVDDKQNVTRVANLCVWAKANSVLLIPVLTSDEDLGKVASSNRMADFAPALITKLRSADGQQWGAYAQIAYYQISDRINNPGLHGGRSAQQLQQGAISAAEGLRKAEIQALQSTNLQPTPIMVSMSFDYELIRQGAISGVALDTSAQEKALAALKDFLGPVAASPNIEVINVEYLPRSISAGDVDGFAPLLRSVKNAAPAKQLALVTGFSTGFHNPDEQRQFLILTAGNLADFRASDGAGTPFLGAIFREGLAGQWASPSPEPDVSQWQWPQRAKELQDMWSQGKSSPDLKWWLEKTEANLGLVQMPASGSGGTTTALPGLQAFQQIASAAQAAQAASAAQPAPPAMVPVFPQGTAAPAPGPAAGSLATAFPGATVPQPAIAMNAVAPTAQGQSQFQQMIFTLLSQFTTQLTTVFINKLNGGAGANLSPGNATPQSVPAAASPMPFAASPMPDASAGIAPTSPTGAQPVASTTQPGSSIAQSAAQPAYAAPTAPPPDNTVNSAAAPGPSSSNPAVPPTQPDALSNSGPTLAKTAPADSSSVTPPVQPGSALSPVSPPSGAASTNTIGDNGALSPNGLPIPQISYFGAISNGVGVANQTPPVVLQLINPSNAITPPVQAELRLDEASVATRQIDPMLPKQLRSLLFPPLSTAAGSHTLDIMMSGPEGAAASATATLIVQPTAPAPLPPAVPLPGIVPAAAASVPLGVRSALPGIAAISPLAVPAPVRAAPLLVVPRPPAGGTTTRVPAVRTVLPGTAPIAPTASATPVRSAPASSLPARTILPGPPPSTAPAAATPARPVAGTVVPTNAAGATTIRPIVRTIVPPPPGSVAAAATPVRPGPRTVVPPTAATPALPRAAVPPSNPQALKRNPTSAATPTAPAGIPNCQPTNNAANTGNTASSTQANKNPAPCRQAQK